jgi:hypothetical protein
LTIPQTGQDAGKYPSGQLGSLDKTVKHLEHIISLVNTLSYPQWGHDLNTGPSSENNSLLLINVFTFLIHHA